ncbi:putative hscarg dehydrogenase [Aspergillus affinis]|uniref:putative hscarg dehydrogenase n=1 Tax=Aspergillus affinis TaxID=1070780 RepID=UPI0022FEC9F1|nr:putative hscarg dehydrogenase [Aspergillus affinis]KAI9041080.1 putative hscarg dehydrogenase [Aspergillus affinis]
MSSKLIVVLGATGNQGGSVIKSFIKDPAWRIRALTRNTSSASAQALRESGVEVVQANLDDPSSLEAAFQDANAIFAVTDFWNSFANPEN